MAPPTLSSPHGIRTPRAIRRAGFALLATLLFALPPASADGATSSDAWAVQTHCRMQGLGTPGVIPCTSMLHVLVEVVGVCSGEACPIRLNATAYGVTTQPSDLGIVLSVFVHNGTHEDGVGACVGGYPIDRVAQLPQVSCPRVCDFETVGYLVQCHKAQEMSGLSAPGSCGFLEVETLMTLDSIEINGSHVGYLLCQREDHTAYLIEVS